MKHTVMIIVIALFAILACSCNLTKKVSTINTNQSLSHSQPAADTPTLTSETLNIDQVTKDIAVHLQNQEPTFTLHILGKTMLDQMNSVLQHAMDENDYIHTIIKDAGYEASWTTESDIAVTFTVGYIETKKQTAYVENRVQETLKQIIQPNMNDFQKEKAIHDYIVSTIAYDTSQTIHSAYGGLVQGKTVCEGFTLLTNRMLIDAGIQNRIEIGTAGGVNHAWNDVFIDGNWYQLDTTWDDPVPFEKGRMLYNYYNLTNEQLKKDHTWKDASYPVASTDFSSILQAKEQSDPGNKPFYSDLLTKAAPQLFAINSIHELQRQINAAFSAQKSQLHLSYMSTNRDVEKDLNTAMANASEFGVKDVKYTVTKGMNDVLVIDFTMKY